MSHRLTWDQFFDTPAITTHYQEEEEHYTLVKRTNRKYRKPPTHISLTIKRMDGYSDKNICFPGSIIEGIVKVKVDTPISAHHLKVIFKASEEILDENYTLHSDYLFKKKTTKREFFSVQTTLWGIHSDDQQDDWPLLSTGEHQFPFMCEMPRVNYPPTFHHTTAHCEFELIASLERPGLRPFHTLPALIHFEPIVLSTGVKQPRPLIQHKTLRDQTRVALGLPQGRDYNLSDSESIQVQFMMEGKGIRQVQLALKRKVRIRSSRVDTVTLARLELNSTKAAYAIPLVGITTNVNHLLSDHIQIDYHLDLTARIKRALIWSKPKLLLSIPLHFGTTAWGEQLPSNLLNFCDQPHLSIKPKFIKIPHQQFIDQLPAYHEDTCPPNYLINLS